MATNSSESPATPAPQNSMNIITALRNVIKDQNGESITGERIAQLLAQNMGQLDELARQGKLNPQQIQQLKEYADRYKPTPAAGTSTTPGTTAAKTMTRIPLSPIRFDPKQNTSSLEPVEQQEQCQSSNFTSSFVGVNSSAPPDLTQYIDKDNDQYYAGGGFGDVYRCRYRKGLCKEVAVKSLRFKFAIDGDPKNTATKMLRRELGIWKRLNHVNIVPFLGIAYGFGMCGSMSLVSLWMDNESLHNFLAKYDETLAITHRLQLLLDVANGLDYLHSITIVHGDLNSNNVLLDADYNARLADFGYASMVGNTPEALDYLQRSTTRSGALRWIAPEQVNPEEYTRTTKSDIYSFGCIGLQEGLAHLKRRVILILLQVLSGERPWSEVKEDIRVVVLLSNGCKPGRPTSRKIDDSHWNLIQNCWSAIKERPDAKAIALTIQRLLNDCPEFPPLRESLRAAKLSSSKVTTNGSGTDVDTDG